MATPGGDSWELPRLFQEVLALPVHQRPMFLDALSPALREELQAMLRVDEGSETFLGDVIASAQPALPGLGERFGPYETRELLGRGGMGAVFKAVRIDGELAQTVAIKVVERTWLDPRTLDRFRQERQFLAGLEHPNIARLIDGGTRPDGVAYLVMEYVDGQRIDRYCAEKQLAVADRLRLCLPLCDAVEHAHQKLIVHRDLKPSNVLVTAGGQPKLLDFGVAKALDVSSAGSTQTLVLTPDFASPEQAGGGEITVATDVYGLGAVLYFLLTGKPPHQADGLSAAELRRAICETPPLRPSALQSELKGDLENILLKALNAEPSRRYHSVRELAEEMERYLAHRPVRATPDSRAYRLRRFVRRNTFASIAAALAVMAAAAGTGVSLYQAQRARERFAQVRDLANRFIFDFEAAIRDTPGTLSARRMMASTARQYLANLAADAGGDPALQRELAESYYRLSQVESAAREYDLWLEDLKKSAAILRSLHDDYRGQPEQRALYVKVLDDMVHYWIDRSPREGVPIAAESLRVARAFYDQYPGEALPAKALIESLYATGDVQMNVAQFEVARRNLEDAVGRANVLLGRIPGDDDLAWQRAVIGNQLSGGLNLLGRFQDALDVENTSAAILDRLIAKRPENVRWRNLRIKMGASTATLLRKLSAKDPLAKARVLPAMRVNYSSARENAERNPGNNEALDLAAVMTNRLANQLAREQQLTEALSIEREALATLDVLGKRDPDDHRILYLRAANWADEGAILCGLKRWQDASATLTEAQKLLQRIVTQWPDDFTALDVQVSVLAEHSLVERNLGRPEMARDWCRLGFEAAAKAIAVNRESKRPVSDIELLRQEGRVLGVAEKRLATDEHR